jgi:hypothetical protein
MLLSLGVCIGIAPALHADSTERQALSSLRSQIETDPEKIEDSKLRLLERTARSRHAGEAKVAAATEALALHDLRSGN